MNRGRDEAQRIGWLTWFAAATQLRARQRLWTGTTPTRHGRHTRVEIFSSGKQMYLPASAYCLARALIESDQDDEADHCSRRDGRADARRRFLRRRQHDHADA